MEFDSRMTEETKDFVKKSEALSILVNDPVGNRPLADAIAEMLYQKYTFDNVEEKEFFADSLYDNHKIALTAFVPKTVSPTSSIVVFFHGGGFNLGSRKSHRNPTAYLADHSNKIWVSVEYRLAPEHKHPTQVQDCISATKWVLENKTKALNASPDAKVGTFGDSAAGYLATSVAKELREALSFQVMIYSWLDLSCSSDSYREFASDLYLLPEKSIKLNRELFLKETSAETLKSESPVFWKNLSGMPKAFLLGAEMDPLLGDSHMYHKRLQEAGVSSELYVVKGALHGFFFAFMDYKNAFLEAAVEILKFLNRF